MKFTIALIAAVVASTAAAPVRQRTETQYKSAAVKSDENYDPYMGIGGQRELEGSMSMAEEGSMHHDEDDHHEDDGLDHMTDHHDEDGHDHGEEEEKVDSTDKSSG